MPSTSESLLIIVLFILPGFIVIRVIGFFIRASKSSDLNTILSSILFSCVNYIILFPYLTDVLQNLQKPNFPKLNLSLSIILVTIISPILIGVIIASILRSNFHYYIFQWRPIKWCLKKLRLDTVIQTNDVWSFVFDREYQPWVRIHLDNGLIYQGIAKHIDSDSEKQTFYITNVTVFDKEGNIKSELDKKGLEGVYIAVKENKVIEVYE